MVRETRRSGRSRSLPTSRVVQKQQLGHGPQHPTMLARGSNGSCTTYFSGTVPASSPRIVYKIMDLKHTTMANILYPPTTHQHQGNTSIRHLTITVIITPSQVLKYFISARLDPQRAYRINMQRTTNSFWHLIPCLNLPLADQFHADAERL